MKYIDADRLKAEIDKRLQENADKALLFGAAFARRTAEDNEIVNLIDSLSQEQPEVDLDDRGINMTLEEAIIHCKEKACDNTQCALEHRQLAKWLQELQQYRKNARKKQNLTEIKVVYPNNPKRKEEQE